MMPRLVENCMSVCIAHYSSGRTWKPGICHDANFVVIGRAGVVVMANASVASDDKDCTMMCWKPRVVRMQTKKLASWRLTVFSAVIYSKMNFTSVSCIHHLHYSCFFFVFFCCWFCFGMGWGWYLLGRKAKVQVPTYSTAASQSEATWYYECPLAAMLTKTPPSNSIQRKSSSVEYWVNWKWALTRRFTQWNLYKASTLNYRALNLD